MIVAACGAGLGSSTAQADEGRIGPFQLLPTAQVATDGTSSVEATPVQWGFRRGYYSGGSRPYYGGYYGGYYPYRSYYSYRYPSYGYRYPSYGYRYPYYTGYRGWYGGWY